MGTCVVEPDRYSVGVGGYSALRAVKSRPSVSGTASALPVQSAVEPYFSGHETRQREPPRG